MSVTEGTKDDFTFKKSINREHTTTAKEWYEENPGEGFLVPDTRLWQQANEIPSTPPGASTSLIDVYDPITLTHDATVSGKKCWRCKTNGTQLRNFIPPTFGANYAVRLFTDVGMTDEVVPSTTPWIFDYENGVLDFENTQTYSNLYLKCYRYKGEVGVTIEKAKDVDASGIGNNKILVFKTASAKHEYEDPPVVCMTWWSDVDDEILLPAAAADVNLPDVVVAGIPSGKTLVQAIVILKVRAIENTNAGGTNAIQGAQNIRVKKNTGSWGVDDVAAINLADNMWLVAASTREFGDVVVGDNDVKSEVDGNATYNLRFENADVDLASLKLNDVQVGIRIWFY